MNAVADAAGCGNVALRGKSIHPSSAERRFTSPPSILTRRRRSWSVSVRRSTESFYLDRQSPMANDGSRTTRPSFNLLVYSYHRVSIKMLPDISEISVEIEISA